MELGECELSVDDISVRSKYGTDLIFKLTHDAENQKNAGICTLKADYNKYLLAECHDLNGKWDAKERAWIFKSYIEDQVEVLDEIFNSALIVVDFTLHDVCSGRSAIYIFGVKVAEATGRDSGAKIINGSLLKGGFGSGGSAKNWETTSKEGTVVRMELPYLVFEKYKDTELGERLSAEVFKGDN